KILVPATDIPEVGKFAIVSDPQGAAFAVFQSVKPTTKPETQGVGRMSWAELNTTDHKSAWKFYSDLFGWKPTRSMDLGEMGEYFMFGTDTENSMGGMSDAAKMMNAPAHWMFYVNVENIDETAKAVANKGGKILNGPMEVPGGDRVAQCMDPQGAAFGIFSPKK
ncbi:MAG TPA: VOC family protein, partial [Vulgatibacter sp.]